MPRLSVLMPVKNAGHTIATAVDSTLRAMPADAELVVLDDGSSDGTSEILDRYVHTGSQVRLLRQSASLGVARALDRLMEATDSDIVARMDADDICLPWRFRRQEAALKRVRGINFTTAVVHVEGRKSLRPQLPIGLSSTVVPLHLLLGNPFVHSTMLGRRDALNSVGGYRQVAAEDYDLWLRASAAGISMSRLATPGVIYRKHKNQVTAQKQWRDDAARAPETATAHSDLVEVVFGTRLRVFEFIRGAYQDQQVDGGAGPQLNEFLAAVNSQSRHMGVLDRLLVSRRLRSLSGLQGSSSKGER